MPGLRQVSKGGGVPHLAVKAVPPANGVLSRVPRLHPDRSIAMSTAAPELIPVRALNQVTYCPRLYYLQYVDAVMPTNEHVEGGLFDHRRVDEPELANKTRKEGDANRSRGVHLSSETLGVSGVLDVIEEKNGES